METLILIIDDNITEIKEHSFVWELEDIYGKDNIIFKETGSEGINYITENLNRNIIVLLDIDFPRGEMNGHDVLAEIRKLSELIPIILFSAIDENKEPFSDFINNNVFGFLSKLASSDEIVFMVEKAESYFSTSLDNTIEDWIIQREDDKDKPIYYTSDGKSYSLNDILLEIRTQTNVGKSFSKKLNQLTIDLLLRQKERL